MKTLSERIEKLLERGRTSGIDEIEESLLNCLKALDIANRAIGVRSKLMRHLDHDFLPGSKAREMQSDALEVVNQGWHTYECVTMPALAQVEKLVAQMESEKDV